MSPESRSLVAWGAVGAFVAVFDLMGDDSLSSAFERGRESENAFVRIAVIGGLALTAAHLMDWIPEQIDPFNIIDRSYHVT